jgi:hypothetical protein
MRVLRARHLAPAVVGAVLLAGCAADLPPPEPVPTDGPNQVVVYVPTMT